MCGCSITSGVNGITITPAITVTGQTAALKVTSDSDWTTAQILCICYDASGRMISVGKAVSGISKGSVSYDFSLPADSASVKAFILNSESYSPYIAAATCSVS